MDIEELAVPSEVKRLLKAQGLSTLYPPQEEAVKAGVLEGRNFVLASPTASGKTLVAELCAMKHIFERGGKILYMTPLRALASEKFEEFKAYTKLIKPDGRKIRVAISTGDYDGSDSWLGRYDIVVVTNEKCDSLLRHRSEWIDSVTLVVADEVHVLNDLDRGPTLEVTLTRLTEINPKIQILALSATIRNASEIAEWLRAGSITTEWRPVRLIEGVYYDGECQFNDGSAIKVEDSDDSNPGVHLAAQVVRQGGQVLVFAETRAKAVTYAKNCSDAIGKLLSRPERRSLEVICQRLLSPNERTRIEDNLSRLVTNGVGFHHAGLAPATRKLIEDSFREGRIKVVSATPTLAAGVNLPARRAIISSYQRYELGYGRNPISVLEYKQMAGRAGRPKYDRVGEAVLIARTADEQDYLMESYVLAKPERIWSKLAVEKVLRGHVLASVAAGFTLSEKGVKDFFEKTFYAHQYGPEMIGFLVSKALSYLNREKMIAPKGQLLEATTFGRRVSELYIDPASAVVIRDALEQGAENITELSFLHMICHTPDSPRYYPRSSEMDELVGYTDLHADEFLVPIPEIGDEVDYQAFLGEVKIAKVLGAWMEEVSEDQIIEAHRFEPGDLFRLIDSAKWLLYATFELGRLFGHTGFLSKILEVRERVDKGVKRELLPIVSLRGVGRVRGRMLFNARFTTIRALKEASVKEIAAVPTLGPSLAKRIKEQVGGLIKAEEWQLLKSGREWEQKSLREFRDQ